MTNNSSIRKARMKRTLLSHIASSFVIVLVIAGAVATCAPAVNPEKGRAAQAKLGFLAASVLSHASVTDLPGEILLRASNVIITTKDIDVAVGTMEAAVRDKLLLQLPFLLEQIATEKLLSAEARNALGTSASADQRTLIGEHFKKLVSVITVDESEMKRFYDENTAMMGGAAYEAVKSQIGPYLRERKQSEFVASYIRDTGKRTAIEVSSAWIDAHYDKAIDNPVDKVRLSGKPSIVDFGAHGCGPCDMMTPILAELEKQYAGKINVLFVPVREEQILGARFGIQSIPVQVFFDKAGNEVFRHTGFFSKADIERTFADHKMK